MGGRSDDTLLREVIGATPTPIWVIAQDRTVQLVNDAALALLGYGREADVVGRPSHETLHARHPDGSDYPAHTCPILDPAGSSSHAAPEWFLTRGGTPVPVIWQTRRLAGAGATLLSFEDASDRLGLAEHGGPPRRRRGEALLAQVREQFHDPDFTVETLAASNHMSVRSVQAVLAEAGTSPAAEIRTARIEHARRLLEAGACVSEASARSGFLDVGTFSRAFRRQYGTTPGRWGRIPVASAG